MSKARKDQEPLEVVDQMPLFPGAQCGQIKKYKKRRKCAERALTEYIHTEIRYPKKAHKKKTQGMVVIGFVVEPHGVMSDPKILRDPGDGLGKAALKVVKKLMKDNTRWEPGLQDGKPVRVQFKLPIYFELE